MEGSSTEWALVRSDSTKIKNSPLRNQVFEVFDKGCFLYLIGLIPLQSNLVSLERHVKTLTYN